MFVFLLELPVGGKTDDTEKGRDTDRRFPKCVRGDVHKGKSWPRIAQIDQPDLMETERCHF